MEKPCTDALGRMIYEETEKVFGIKKMMLNKKDTERVTGMTRRQTEAVFGARKLMSVMDIARKMSASK
jgi:uncharacterized protein YjcR